MSKFAKFLEALKGAEALMELATAVAQMLERFIPESGKGQVKREIGSDLIRRIQGQEEVDPVGLALDLAVSKLKASGEFK